MATLKRELKEVQDEAAAEKEKLARLRLTCEQQGKQLRAMRFKDAIGKDGKFPSLHTAHEGSAASAAASAAAEAAGAVLGAATAGMVPRSPAGGGKTVAEQWLAGVRRRAHASSEKKTTPRGGREGGGGGGGGGGRGSSVAARLDAWVREGAEWERRNESREGESSSPSADEYESATAALLLTDHRPEQRSEWSGCGLNHSMSDSAHPYGGVVSAHGGANASAARHAGALAEEVSTLRQVNLRPTRMNSSSR